MATLRKTSRGSLAILLSDDLYIYCFTVCVRFLQQQAAAHRRTNTFRVILSGVPQSQILGYVLYKHAERSRSFAQAKKTQRVFERSKTEESRKAVGGAA